MADTTTEAINPSPAPFFLRAANRDESHEDYCVAALEAFTDWLNDYCNRHDVVFRSDDAQAPVTELPITDFVEGRLPLGAYHDAPDSVVYSNLGHRLDAAVAAVMRTTPCIVTHTAWDYRGRLWFIPDRELYYEAVSSNHKWVALYASADLQSLIRFVVSKHGRR